MMPTFPLINPTTFGISSMTWIALSNDAYTHSPFTFQLIKQIFDGRMWRGSLSIMTRNDANRGRELSAWLTSLRRAGTNAGTFLLGEPGATLPLGSAKDTPGAPLVDGAAQTGEALNVKGLPLSANGYLLAGDYIQLGTGISSRLKKVLDDVNSDGSGDATMNLWPPIRDTEVPVDSSAVVVSGAEGLFVSPSASSSWQVRPPVVYGGVTLDVSEVVT